MQPFEETSNLVVIFQVGTWVVEDIQADFLISLGFSYSSLDLFPLELGLSELIFEGSNFIFPVTQSVLLVVDFELLKLASHVGELKRSCRHFDLNLLELCVQSVELGLRGSLVLLLLVHHLAVLVLEKLDSPLASLERVVEAGASEVQVINNSLQVKFIGRCRDELLVLDSQFFLGCLSLSILVLEF